VTARGRLQAASIALAMIVAVLAAAAACSPAAAHSRGHSVALGAYVSSAKHPGRLHRYTRIVGRPPVIVGSYKQWRLSPFPRSELEPVWRSGAVPMITWEPWTYREKGFPLRRIAAGAYDGYVRGAARAAEAWGHPILLRFAHEMNGNWYPWGRSRNTPAVYKAAWRHVVSVFRAEGALNLKWVWTPNVDNSGRYPFARFYPGDRWVDWVGLDGFNWGARERWQSFGEIFDRSYRVLTRLSRRPVIIAETGSSERGGSKARWVRRALDSELPRLTRIRALVWFSQPFNGVDVRVNTSHAALKALRKAVRAPRYRPNRTGFLEALPPIHF
jgi:hypothetical protein